MDITKLKRIFDFLEEKEEQNPPFMWKWKNGIPLIEEDLEVGGDLDLRDSKITSLPEGLKVGGDLDLTYTNIKSLPKGLKVGGDLYLMFSTISSLPKGLEVGGGLYIYGTPLQKYTDDELIEMIKPGFIKEWIFR